MYKGVPIIWPKLREQRLLGQLLADRLGHAEVDHLGHRLAVVQRDHDVARLEVPVDDRPSDGRAEPPDTRTNTTPAALRRCESCSRRSTR